MKTKLFLSMLVVAGIIFFNSCKKDDPSPLTKDEAKTELNSTETDYTADITALNADQGYKAQMVVSDLNLPCGDLPIKKVAKDKSALIENVKNAVKLELARKLIREEGDFQFLPGTYTYNKSTYSFTKTGTTPPDKMVLLFPYPITNETNNATLTIYDYTSTTIYGQTVPTQIKAKIEIGSQQVWSLVATQTITSSMDYSYNVVTTFGKFTHTQQFSLNVTTSQITSSMLEELKKDGVVIFKVSSDGVYKFLQNQEVHISLNAKIIIKNIELRVNIEKDTSSSAETDPNIGLKMSLYTTGGAKIGDIKLVKIETYWEPYIYYDNGDSEALKNLINNVLEEIVFFVESFFDVPSK